MKIANHSLTTSVTTIIAGEKTHFLDLVAGGAGDTKVGVKLTAGSLDDFITLAPGDTLRIETKAMKTSTFYAVADTTSTLTVIHGSEYNYSDDKTNKFAMTTKTVEFAPADKAAMLVFNSDREFYSYLKIKNIDPTNSVAFSFEANGTDLGGNFTLAAGGGTKTFDTKSLGGIALYAKANIADCAVEFIYG
jgi:hypothetical protein